MVTVDPATVLPVALEVFHRATQAAGLPRMSVVRCELMTFAYQRPWS